jgi:hypothetical protein
VKDYRKLKFSTNKLASDAQIPTEKLKKYKGKKRDMTPPKLNNSAITNTNDGEVDEISDQEFFLNGCKNEFCQRLFFFFCTY